MVIVTAMVVVVVVASYFLLEEATEMVEGSDIKVTTEEGPKILCAHLRRQLYFSCRIRSEESKRKVKIAEMHPRAAYATFFHVIVGKWQYIMRTIEDVGGLLHPIEEATSSFWWIPMFTRREKITFPTKTL